MFRLILHNLKHFLITFTLLFILLVGFGIYIGADAHLMQNPLAYQLNKEGPHIFIENDQLSVKTIRGNSEDGFYLDQETHDSTTGFEVNVHFALEALDFKVIVNPVIQTPAVDYHVTAPIIALSDIESGFKAFRDFLVANQVINEQLEWTFGNGHLVLVGDFVDRGDSVTQVLWLIYKLEQEALAAGGLVHFILGNHEIKNLQGNFQSASKKYFYIAAMLEKGQHELYGEKSFIGKWMASKNSVEKINDTLFTHGGIHPQIADMNFNLKKINNTIRENYRKPYFTKQTTNDTDFLISTTTGPSWYRGYFKDELTIAEIDQVLHKFGAKSIVVGHTIHSQVKKFFDGRVYAIDVKHPKDYLKSFPIRRSEGLMIDKSSYIRLLEDGSRQKLN